MQRVLVAIVFVVIGPAVLAVGAEPAASDRRTLELVNSTAEDVVFFVQRRHTLTAFFVPQGNRAEAELVPGRDARVIVVLKAGDTCDMLASPAKVLGLTYFVPPQFPFKSVVADIVSHPDPHKAIGIAIDLGDSALQPLRKGDKEAEEALRKRGKEIDDIRRKPAVRPASA